MARLDLGEVVPSDAVRQSQVVNNFTTSNSGYVADARTVKVLNDKVSGLIRIQTESIVKNVTAGSFVTTEISVATLSGYTLVGIFAYTSNDNTAAVVEKGGDKYYVTQKNFRSDNVQSMTAYITALFVKT